MLVDALQTDRSKPDQSPTSTAALKSPSQFSPGIPASKTFKAFVKPVAVVVKERIDTWLEDRPANQTALLDERTGEKVSYLFQFRVKRIGSSVINGTIIPMLCAKASVPLEDSRGRITSHRGACLQ